jgi:hypothetical protein
MKCWPVRWGTKIYGFWDQERSKLTSVLVAFGVFRQEGARCFTLVEGTCYLGKKEEWDPHVWSNLFNSSMAHQTTKWWYIRYKFFNE